MHIPLSPLFSLTPVVLSLLNLFTPSHTHAFYVVYDTQRSLVLSHFVQVCDAFSLCYLNIVAAHTLPFTSLSLSSSYRCCAVQARWRPYRAFCTSKAPSHSATLPNTLLLQVVKMLPDMRSGPADQHSGARELAKQVRGRYLTALRLAGLMRTGCFSTRPPTPLQLKHRPSVSTPTLPWGNMPLPPTLHCDACPPLCSYMSTSVVPCSKWPLAANTAWCSTQALSQMHRVG